MKPRFEKAVSRWLPSLPTSARVLNVILLPTLRCMLNTSLKELMFSYSLCYLLYYYGQRENANTLLRGIDWL